LLSSLADEDGASIAVVAEQIERRIATMDRQ
jgi:hypothetical protein